MILHVNFRYGAKVFGHRKRTPSDRTYLGVVPVEIREVAAVEAPVALRFKAGPYNDVAPNQLLNLLWMDEKLWRPAFEVRGANRGDGSKTAEPRTADWVTHCAEKGYLSAERSDNVLPVGTSNYHEPEPRPIEEDLDVGRIQVTEMEDRAREIALAAQDVMIVDGIVHVVCPEPVYAVSQPGFSMERHEPYAAIEFLGSGKARFPAYTYRADEVDYMADRFGIEAMGVDDVIEVVRPEAVRYDGPAVMMLGAAESLRDWMKGRIADRGLDFFKAYMTLRDGLSAESERRASADRPSVQADEVTGLVREALDFLGDEECHRHQADAALERLDAIALANDLGGIPTP